jgi:ADP-ribose pyrophosphatase YjhB (NUDIX family)
MDSHPAWLIWAQKLDALAQVGLTFTTNPFDIERYHKIREISSEIISSYSQANLAEIKDLLDSQAGYSTPKIDIRGCVFKNDKLLLVKELADGGWTMPGGWVDVDEPPSRAAEREVWEESGYEVKATRLLAVYDRNQHDFPPYIFHSYKIFIQCELIGGQPTTSIETGGAEFFAEDDLPTLSLPRTTPDVIHRMFALYRSPQALAEFD